MLNEQRDTGLTTRQMQAAPQGAVYVWCNSVLGYPTDLAQSLGRHDLKIVRPSWLEPKNVRGLVFTDVIIDHAAVLDESQRWCLAYIRIKP